MFNAFQPVSRKFVGLLTAAALSSPMAHAATETADFDVQLVIEGACTITASLLDFGTNSGSIDANIDQDGALAVNCTNGTDYTIALDDGDGLLATTAARKMTHPDGSTVDYTLYQDATRTTLWGSGANAYSGTGTGSEQSIPVHGRVPAGQSNVTVGTYSDNIVATIEF